MKWMAKIMCRIVIDRAETLNPSRINIFQRLGYKFWKAATSPLMTRMQNNRWRSSTRASRENITVTKVRSADGFEFTIPLNRNLGESLLASFQTL